MFVFSAGMLDDLHDMLQKDPDAQVVANCMSVLLEVRQHKHSILHSVTRGFLLAMSLGQRWLMLRASTQMFQTRLA